MAYVTVNLQHTVNYCVSLIKNVKGNLNLNDLEAIILQVCELFWLPFPFLSTKHLQKGLILKRKNLDPVEQIHNLLKRGKILSYQELTSTDKERENISSTACQSHSPYEYSTFRSIIWTNVIFEIFLNHQYCKYSCVVWHFTHILWKFLEFLIRCLPSNTTELQHNFLKKLISPPHSLGMGCISRERPGVSADSTPWIANPLEILKQCYRLLKIWQWHIQNIKQ